MGMAEEICKENGSLAFTPGLGRDERNRLFEARHELGEMITRVHTDCRVQVIDVAVPITGYPDIISTARQKADEAGIPGYAFSHAGDGNLHLCLAGRKDSEADWERINSISQYMVSKAIALGGTATGEHGVGIGKCKYMPDEHGRSLNWMKNIKSLFDPNGILNPGKIFP
jgi:D-lactate dehydrogenase (cytochrome)